MGPPGEAVEELYYDPSTIVLPAETAECCFCNSKTPRLNCPGRKWYFISHKKDLLFRNKIAASPLANPSCRIWIAKSANFGPFIIYYLAFFSGKPNLQPLVGEVRSSPHYAIWEPIIPPSPAAAPHRPAEIWAIWPPGSLQIQHIYGAMDPFQVCRPVRSPLS